MNDGSYEIPERYPFALEVPGGPDGGARCSTCRYLSKDGTLCLNRIYLERMGTTRLPTAAERWCCALWTSQNEGPR